MAASSSTFPTSSSYSPSPTLPSGRSSSTSSTTHSLSFPSIILGTSVSTHYGISPSRHHQPSTRVSAKFDKFQGGLEGETVPQVNVQPQTLLQQDGEEEDDSCLPSDLVGAVQQSSQAAATFISSGGMRAIVELLIPQLQFLNDEGAQAELWELSRLFLETLIAESGLQRVRAIFPDAGAAALLKYQWTDAEFRFSSLTDRKPVESDDELVVMIVPDYQMLKSVEKIASDLSDDPPRPLIMWNPRLISEEVGVGSNVRNLKRFFLSTFTTVYSMRPLPTGAVFRCYPGMWKVFSDDKDRPNRYLLAKEVTSRPDAEDIEIIFGGGEESEAEGSSLLTQVASVFSSINRFMRAISK